MSLLDIATLGLRIDARQVRDGDRALQELGRTGERTERTVDKVSSAMKRMAAMAAAVASALAIAEAIKLADEMALLDARLKAATGSMREFAQASRDVYAIAQKNSVSIQSLTELYTKLADPIRRVGGGVNEVRGVVDAFSTALRVGGASADDAARAVLQFSQAMGQGKLSGDEFTALAESSQRFLKALADGSGYPIEQLKKLGSEGKLTSDIVGNALLKSLDKLNKEAAAMPDTVGGAFQRVKNDIAVAVRDINNSVGATSGLAYIVDSVRPLIPMIRDELVRAFIMVDQWIERNKEGIKDTIKSAGLLVSQIWELSKAAASVAGFAGEMGNKFGALKIPLIGIAYIVAGLQDGVTMMGAGFAQLGSIILKSMLSPLNRVADITTRILEVIDPARAEAFKGFVQEANNFADAGMRYAAEVMDQFGRGETATVRLATALALGEHEAAKLTATATKAGEAVKTLAPKGGPSDEQVKAYEKAVKAAAEYADNLRREREEIGLTDSQLTMLNAQRAAAVAPTAALARSILSNADALVQAREADAAATAEKDRYTQAVEAQLEARLGESLAAQQAVDQAQIEVDTYGMGAAAITRYTIAKLEAQKAGMMLAGATEGEVAHLDRLIAKNGELLDLQNRKDDLDALFDTERAESFGDALRDAFGSAGDSLSRFGSAFESFVEKQAEADQARAKAKLKYAGDDKRIAREVGKINDKQEKDRISAYAEMAGAAKGFFKENTTGYKVMEAAERGFRTYELAMNTQAMFAKLAATQATTTATVTGNAQAAASAATSATTQIAANQAVGMSSAVAGVANQAKGDPYSAFARMAAMAAIMAALGFAVSGGRGSKPNTSSAEYVQKNQGTGSVFGDDSAKSESIARSLELLEDNSDMLLPLTADMLSSLRGIEAAMGGLANIVLRTAGITTGDNLGIETGTLDRSKLSGNIAVKAFDKIMTGGLLGKLTSLWGSTKQNVTDSGLMFGGRVGDLQGGRGFNQYANVETTKKEWFGLSKKVTNSTQTAALNEEVTAQFALVFKNLETVLSSAAKGLGMEGNSVAQAVRNFVLDTTKLSLKDLKGDELEAAISAVLSKATDDIAQAALPGFDAFRKVGEGYAETVIRVASGIEVADLALERLGIEAIRYADIGNKQGDVAAEIVRQSILAVQAAGGVADIMRTLGGSAEELAATYAELKAVQDSMALVGLNPDSLDRNLIKGAGDLGGLQGALESYFENYFTEAEQVAAKTEQMRQQFAALGVAMPATAPAFRALVEASPALRGQLLLLAEDFAGLMESSESTSNALEIAEQRRQIEIEIMRLQGDEIGALAAERAIELAAMDESLRALRERANLIKDEEDARQKALDDAMSALRRAVEAEKELKTKAYNETMKGYDKAIEATRAKMTKLSGLAQTLNSAREQVGMPDTDRAGAQAQLQSMLAIARAGGVATLDQAKLQKTLGVLAKESGEMFGSTRDYEFDRYQTAIAVGELADLTDNALSTEEKALESLERQREQAKLAHEAEMARLDGILANAQLQLDALRGVDVSVQSVGAALGQFASAVKAIQTAGVGGSGSSPITAPSQTAYNEAALGSIYERVLGRAADASGLEFYMTQLGRGATTLEAIEAAIKTSAEYLDKAASAADSRAIVTQQPATVSASMSGGGAMASAEIVSAVQTMKDELKVGLTAIASYTQRTAQSNEDMNRRERKEEIE